MKYLFQNVKLISSERLVNILVQDTIVTAISENDLSDDAEKVLDMNGAVCSPGFFDLNADFCDPGFEHKENLESGSRAAIYGGFTDVLLAPSTFPVVDKRQTVEYLLTRSPQNLNFHVAAALSENLQGKEMTEMLELKEAGISSFSEGDLPISNSKLLLKALEYVGDLEIPIFQNARDLSLAGNTQMHEGLVSTSLGLSGEPSISEVIIINRDLKILEYAGTGRIHFSRISSAAGISLIREAKSKGYKVTCDVSLLHLLFADDELSEFDTNYKVTPPYRGHEDRAALIDAVIDGTIDAICSNHRPQNKEAKKLEFDLAENGSLGLQTFLPCLLKLREEIGLGRLLACVTDGPRNVLGKKCIAIEVGQNASFTFFNTSENWLYNSASNQSKSENSPFLNQTMTGKVVGTFTNGQITLL